MSISRINIETIIVSSLGPLMEEAGMEVTEVGTNADLDYPLAAALDILGYSIAAIDTATDVEIAALSQDDWRDFVSLVKYFTLLSVEGNLALVDITAGPRSEKFSQLSAQVGRMIESMRVEVGGIMFPPEGGYISLDFAEHNG